MITGPYAPQIPYNLYLAEKRNWAGTRIGASVYGTATPPTLSSINLTSRVRFVILGIVIVLFFNCLSALLGPANRARSLIKWALVAHVGAMFTFQTISIATQLHIESISYIDNRALPDSDGSGYSGPFAYEFLIYNDSISMTSLGTFLLNNWLADGLLVGPVTNSVTQVFNLSLPPALPLLCYFFKQLLGDGHPIPDVPYLFECVLSSSAGRQLHYSLTPPTQH